MLFTLKILKAVLLFVALPILTTVYVDKARTLAATLPRAKRWTYKNSVMWWLLITASTAIALELWSPRPQLDDGRNSLTFFGPDTFQLELDGVTQGPLAKSEERSQLLRKFQSGCYAYDKKDFSRAIEEFSAIETGKDNVGALPQFQSAVLFNNLACACFQKQRNSGFRSSAYFTRAVEVAGSTHPQRAQIEKNIKALDILVNTLD